MTVESPRDIEGLRRIGRIVALVIRAMHDATRPGITTRELDAIGAAVLKEHGARSAPQIMYKFPSATCISINDVVAHGIADDREIRAGDLVNIDVSAELNGYFGDAGMSFQVPPLSEDIQRLCAAGQQALHAAIAAARAENRINALGRAVEQVAAASGYRIIRDLGGHGVGRALHEEPRRIPNYFTNRAKDRLIPGLVITIEPFLTPGKGQIATQADGWTLKTTDGAVGVQYEHTVIVTEGDPILTTYVEGVTLY
jgi:methionyl aminopeptidase